MRYGFSPVALEGAVLQLIATDLDGTLVRTDDTVSPYTYQVLERVRAAGIPVVGATGRGPRLLGLTRRDLPTAAYLVLGGGGRVVDLTGEAPVTLLDVRMDGPATAVLLDELEMETGPLTVMVEARDDPYAPLLGDVDPTWPWPVAVEPVPRARALDRDVIKVLVRADGLDPDVLLGLAARVIPPAKASLTQAGLGFVEIGPTGVDKASGLAVVAEALGVDPPGVLAFGDAPNDLPMLGWAGWRRVAVGNAHPAVRELADEVTLTNDEDGVAVWLDREVL
jgi:hydroxymethylpyrimidine pyrophosphatase-like HAD family hydrolase